MRWSPSSPPRAGVSRSRDLRLNRQTVGGPLPDFFFAMHLFRLVCLELTASVRSLGLQGRPSAAVAIYLLPRTPRAAPPLIEPRLGTGRSRTRQLNRAVLRYGWSCRCLPCLPLGAEVRDLGETRGWGRGDAGMGRRAGVGFKGHFV